MFLLPSLLHIGCIVDLGIWILERWTLRYGHWTDPATDTLGLVSHPRLKKQVFQVDTSSVTISSLLAEARRTDRDQREALYEWARLNVLKVDRLFDKYRRDVVFSKNYRSYYEDLRLIVMRSTNTAPSVVPGCEAYYQEESS